MHNLRPAYKQKRSRKRNRRIPPEALEAPLEQRARQDECHQREDADCKREAIEPPDVSEQIPVELHSEMEKG